MDKLILSGSYDFDEPSLKLMDIHSRGVDRAWMQKRAAVLTGELDGLRPSKGKAYIHLIALGDGESWGANRNADYFSKQANIDNHKTFVTNGHLFMHHQNKDPEKAVGFVKFSAHNDMMSRVELIVEADESKCRNEIEKVAREDPEAMQGVSMACVTDPNYPVLTIDGYKPISQVKQGDKVWTHEGRWQKVTNINRRQYTGEVCKFSINGLPLPLEVTSDHLMMSKVFAGVLGQTTAKAASYFNSPRESEAASSDWAHAEHIDVGDQFMYRAVTEYPGYGKIDNTDLSKIMGYYLAGGSLQYNKDKACIVNFSCNLDDSLLRDLPRITYKLWPDITCSIKPAYSSTKGCSVNLFSTHLAEFIKKMIGVGCKGKVICPEIFNANEDVKLAFLGSWLDGDGWFDKEGGHWPIASVNLALQGRDLLASIGVGASIYCIDHEKCATSGKSGSKKEYTLNISVIDGDVLIPWSDKAAGSKYELGGERKMPTALRACLTEDDYAYRIKSVERRFVENCPTYNIEVENDESYSLAGMASHNCRVSHDICSICGNKARTREDYCTHMKKMAGQILSDGRQVCVDNPSPTFFDISWVFRPADRIAYGLRKVASSDIVTGAELAETEGLYLPKSIIPSGQASKHAGFKRAVLRKLCDIEKQIDGAVKGIDFNGDGSQLIKLRGAFSPEVSSTTQEKEAVSRLEKENGNRLSYMLTGLAKSAVSLSVEDFLKVVMGEKAASIDEGSVKKELPGIYTKLTDEGLGDEICSDGTYDPGSSIAGLPKEVEAAINSMIPGMSLSEAPVQKRVTIISIRKLSKPELTRPSRICSIKEATAECATEALAKEYAKYKLSLLADLTKRGDSDLSIGLGVLQNYV